MSPLERNFALIWVHGIKGPTDIVTQHRFHPVRKWVFDFAHVPTKVAIEIEGGTSWRVRGRHVMPEGFAADCVKYNEATRMGWKVFRLTSKMITGSRLLEIVAFIKAEAAGLN